jgi:hypothetical protein
VELRSQLPRLDLRARSGYGVRRCARVLGGVTASCSADPCPDQNDGYCDVYDGTRQNLFGGTLGCTFGDYIDCHNCISCGRGDVRGDLVGGFSKSAMLRVSGTLPDAIGSLACRSKITSMYAHPQLVTLSLHAFPPFASSPRVGVDNHTTLAVHLHTPPLASLCSILAVESSNSSPSWWAPCR